MKSARSIDHRYFGLAFCVLAAFLSALDEGSASTFKVHRFLIDNEASGNQYYYEPVPTYRPKDRKGPSAAAAAAATITPRPYQRYMACSPRTFLIRGCSLCFCTDSPMLALCWDYEGQACRDMRILAEEQTKTKNNDPNGVW